MQRSILLALALLAFGHALAQGDGTFFTRIASFPVNSNLPSDMDPLTETSSEIIGASADGMTLVYSDSPLGGIGFVDITVPESPVPAGTVMVNGEPTAVSIVGDYVLVGVNTSESFTEPSGHLAVVDIASREIVKTCDLGGQPDSTAVSPDRSIVAVAIENERDEDLNDGVIPQLPAGFVAIFALEEGMPDCESLIRADVTGLADVAGEDPEPEFVDINSENRIAVTLQENNHVVVLDGTDGSVVSHFSTGTVDLMGVDTEEEGALRFDGSLQGVPREPDAIQWLDDTRLVTANEGDYEGGSRGFTIFDTSGRVLYESGTGFEYWVALAGHYPDERSGNKGAEPEGMEVGRFGGETYIFLLSERGSVVGVYRDTGAAPEFVQLLPTALGPEGAVAIPGRDLLAISNEVDLGPDGGVRSHVTLYHRGAGESSYPMIASTFDETGRPIGWGALSGMVADPERPGILYAVNDSFYGQQPSIFTIDATQRPARIISATRITRDGANAQLLDIEGITTDGEGGFWLASEGRLGRLIMHALIHVNADGEIEEQIAFPAELLAVERRWASEGVTMIGDRLWIAIQRQWQDDPENIVKLVSYDLETGAWGAVRYPTDVVENGWVGLSEITYDGDWVYLIERDNQIGQAAQVKKLTRVAVTELEPAPLGGDLPLVDKEHVRDFIPDLLSTGGYAVDKVEGFAIDANGQAYVVTDNDGVDDSNGETLFFTVDLKGGM